MERKEVYKLIDGERNYQETLWSVIGETGNIPSAHSFAEWLVFIEDYVNEAKHLLTRESFVSANPKVGDIMRKVAALAVAALEEHGAEARAR
ncbi:MAG TPA: hypothetical protein PLP33_14690 [Leptospiraceae bacterium]|nr:hypothetical protein [Leptospiraceae bacterium]